VVIREGGREPGWGILPNTMTVILDNGVIWTGDPARPWAESMGVRGNRLTEVGSQNGLSDPARVDLKKAFVCPGLIDAHAHVLGYGRGLTRVDLGGALSLGDALERVRSHLTATGDRGPNAWVRGRGWDQNAWPGKMFPSRQDLDRIALDHRIVLTRVDGHAYWVNTQVLSVAGITRVTKDPPGGRIVRDRSGEPTGILIDTAMDLVTRVLPKETDEEKREAISKAVECLARTGLAGVHDMGMSAREAGTYRDMAAHDALRLRIYGAILADDPDLAGVLDGGPDLDWVGGTFRLGMVKFFMDGALGSRGAALLAPYSDDPGNMGLLRLDADALQSIMESVLGSGFQCAVHAIGDRGNRLALQAWDKERSRYAGHPVPAAPLSSIGPVPARIPPFRLEHAQVLSQEDLRRLGSLGILASMQPTHCTSDMPWAPDRLGPLRLKGAYAWRSIANEGVVLAAGSDFPIEAPEPVLGMYAAVTRKPADGSHGAWSSTECLGREEALAAFTAAPAYASGDLHRLGTLTPGKLADFVVFDRNLVTCDPEELLQARAVLTVVNGRTVWADPKSSVAEAYEETARV
jgi:predicted amidohydrolase YtcJ